MADESFDPVAALSNEQREKLAEYERLLVRFNQKINLISRPSEARVRTEHTLHSLALAWKGFPPGARVVDWGSGGGLPAVPLAVAFPEVRFTAVDANGKKVRAVRAMARRLKLGNLTAWKGRAEAWPASAGEAAGWSVARATAPLEALWRWHRRVCQPPEALPRKGDWPPGLLALKGGDLSEEVAALKETFPSVRAEQYALQPLLEHGFFSDKCIVVVRKKTTDS